jgi:drug/metabolite transporter (DMT)-like permease
MAKQKSILPIIALIIASILWGSNTVFIKIGVASIPVAIFIALRFLAASLIILPFAIKTWKKLRVKELLLLSLSSVFYISLSSSALNMGLTKTSAINASIIYLLEPILLLILSASFLKERLSLIMFIGICVSLVGGLIIIGRPSEGSVGGAELVGNLLVALAAFCFVISTLICKPLAHKVGAYQLTFMNLFPGALLIGIYATFTFGNWNIAATTSDSWQALIASILAVVVANFLFFYALSRKKAMETGIYQYLEAVATIVVAWILLKERPSSNFIIGASLVFIGIYFAEFYKLQANKNIIAKN